MTDDRARAVAEARHRQVLAFRVLDRYGLGGKVAGHLTQRHPGGDAFWTHRFDLGFGEVTEADLVLVDLGLGVREGDAEINPTLHIHAQIYARRPEVGAIVHTHGENVVALSATGAAFVPCSQMAGIFHDAVATYVEEDLIVLTAAQGGHMAEALGGRSALILKNHGSLVVAPTLEEAVLRTLVLEDAAAVQLKAMAAAGAAQPLGPDAADQVKRFILTPNIIDRYWRYEVRRLAGGV